MGLISKLIFFIDVQNIKLDNKPIILKIITDNKTRAEVNPLSSMLDLSTVKIQDNNIGKKILKLVTKDRYNFEIKELSECPTFLINKIEIIKPKINKHKCKIIVKPDAVIEYPIKMLK